MAGSGALVRYGKTTKEMRTRRYNRRSDEVGYRISIKLLQFRRKMGELDCEANRNNHDVHDRTRQ